VAAAGRAQQGNGRDRDQEAREPRQLHAGRCMHANTLPDLRLNKKTRYPGLWTAWASFVSNGGTMRECLTCVPGPRPTVGPWPARVPSGAPPG
jgi:hypothetical protein